jgi:hypothetical protein
MHFAQAIGAQRIESLPWGRESLFCAVEAYARDRRYGPEDDTAHENSIADFVLDAAGLSLSGATPPGRKSKDPRRETFGPVQELSVVSATRADEVGA